MGFSVSCKGADLIQHLRFDEDAIFGRRYPLYIIALAAEVDDEAVKWLVDYGRAVDSLTGQFIAFITFYNSVRFFASSGSPSTIVDREGTTRLFQYVPSTIEVPPHAIQGEQTLEDYVKGRIRFPDEAFVLAMTYESDSVARCLGIKPEELPCFVFIDDPSSIEYHVLPMGTAYAELFDTLRRIVGEFYSSVKNKPYLELIRQLDELQVKLLWQRRTLLQATEESAKRFQRVQSAAKHFGKVLAKGRPSDKDRVDLLQFYDRTLCHILLDKDELLKKGQDLSLEEWESVFHKVLDPENPFESDLQRIRDAINRNDLESIQAVRSAPLTEGILETARGALSITDAIEEVKSKLEQTHRPRIAPILRQIKRAERREIASSVLKRATQKVGENVGTVLKAMEVGLRLAGSA